MKTKKAKYKVLPLDYLEKIGRYRPDKDHKPQNRPGFPEEMLMGLKRHPEVMIEGRAKKGSFNSRKKFLRVRQLTGYGWIVPANWVVRVY